MASDRFLQSCFELRVLPVANPSQRPPQGEGCQTSGLSRSFFSPSCLSAGRPLWELSVIEEFSTLTNPSLRRRILANPLLLSYPDYIRRHDPDERLYLF